MSNVNWVIDGWSLQSRLIGQAGTSPNAYVCVFINNTNYADSSKKKTFKVGKIDCSSDLQKIAKPPISPSSSLLNGLPQNWQIAHLTFGIKWLISLSCIILGHQNLPRILLEQEQQALLCS